MQSRINDSITLRKLEMLLAFMKAGSLNKAAESLGVSAVSVHRSLHSLEEGLRCPLFRHTGRNLFPTEAAHVLADVAEEVLALMEDGMRATREAGGYSVDQLKIGSLYSLTTKTVPEVIMGLKLRRPELQPELILGSNAALLDKLRHGHVDAALLAIPPVDPDLESIPLFEDDVYFAAPPGSPYAGRDAIDLRDCADESFVTLSEGFATFQGFMEAFRVAAFTPNVVMRVGDIFSLMNLVSGGVGYSLLPGRVREVYAHKIQFIPLQPQYLMRQTIGLTFLRARERDPNLLALAATCRMATRRES